MRAQTDNVAKVAIEESSRVGAKISPP